MNNELLDIDVQLLLLRYGRQTVLDALARLAEKTPTDISQDLRSMAFDRPAPRRKTPVRPLSEVAELESRGRAEITEPLRALAVAFEGGYFLPHLRDVRRFLDRDSAAQQKWKSRAAAGPAVIRLLSKLEQDELSNLVTANTSGGESNYALLSRAIMEGVSDDKSDHS